MPNSKNTALAMTLGLALALGACGEGAGRGDAAATSAPVAAHPWMSASIIAEQADAATDADKEAVANRRAHLLLGAMTLEQKMQQLTRARPEIVPELPQCFGGRHVSGIEALDIPTLRISNGPVGLGQNDCTDPKATTGFGAYVSPTSARATALPSAMAAAASFDPGVAAAYGEVIGTEMNNLALHVFEAPGLNMARLPILGRNFEYFGEDPYLTGTMGVAEIRAIQARGLIAMPKHFVGNEQETLRTTIQQDIDRQVMREIYLLPFEMAVKDAGAASIMCAYNYVNGYSSCESREILGDILRNEWGFTGYVQSDFFAMKSTAPTLLAGMDHEMPLADKWSGANLGAALAAGAITPGMIDKALERRYTQMFKHGIFDRAIAQTPIDFTANGLKAREIGLKSAVLLQNNGALPFDATTIGKIVLIGKQTQVYAQQVAAGGALLGKPLGSGGGSSDVVPNYTVTPLEGIRNVLEALGSTATVQLILVDDANSSATIDGASATFAQALSAAAAADAVIVMAGTIAEEGADRATFTAADGKALADSAAAGSSLDWYADKPSVIATASATNPVKNSRTVAMIEAIMAQTSATPARSMAQKTALVLKDNAGVAMPASLVGTAGPAILEAWFPGQEDGNIVAQLLFGKDSGGADLSPSGKLPVTFPYAGKGFLDGITARQFPGVPGTDGVSQVIEYSEMLDIGYRWYDARQESGACATRPDGSNDCVAFPFGHGLSYNTKLTIGAPTVASQTRQISMSDFRTTHTVTVSVTNGDASRAGSEVVQLYVSLPPVSPNSRGAAQPPKRLVGFQKLDLAPGESKEVSFTIDSMASHHPLSIWSKDYKLWVMPPGTVRFHVGNSSSRKDLQTVSSTQ